jgi:DNA-binding GntR family transcriptional regulator
MNRIQTTSLPASDRAAEGSVTQVLGQSPAAPASGAKVKARRPAPSAEEIYDRILVAIMEHRLPPGTKLVEEKLAGIFRVSRTKIRQALGRLAHDKIVTVIRNRGAFVSSPTVDEARQVFNARRIIEPPLIRQLAERAVSSEIARLRQHVALESEARTKNDRRKIIRLSGEFHQLIADMVGNTFLSKTMRDLESLTCLVIILYDSPNIASCPYHEHGDLVDAIEARDAERAAEQMITHLNHVESTLDLYVSSAGEVDLDAVFS